MATTKHLFNRAVEAHLAGNLAGGIDGYRKVLEKEPGHVDGLQLLGLALYQSGHPLEAEPLIRAAIQASPNQPVFHMNLGIVLAALGRHEDAAQSFGRATELAPDEVNGWLNQGNAASMMGDHESAARCFGEVIRITNGTNGVALGYCGLALAVLCEWDGVAEVKRMLRDGKEKMAVPVPPFSMLIHDFDPQEQRSFADKAAMAIHSRAMKECGGKQFDHARRSKVRRDRLRVGFLGDDFQNHPVGYLFVGLAEALDRERFESRIYSYAPESQSEIRRRIKAAADAFVDIHAMGWRQAAERIYADEVDILIDLKGHTGLPRSEILCPRPAPVQVAWLGYPGTFGGEDLDYIIADSFIIPEGAEAAYSETVVRLPYCYQPNDPKRPRASAPVDRAAVGLPPQGFVWGAHNNTFKMTRQMFAVWMEILKQSDGSVLWLLDHHPIATHNLRAAAEKAAVDPGRLIFAPRVGQAEHLSRLSACDVALDTFPYGGHTTTSDYLWAGVPVVSLVGKTFAARVAGSLLGAAGVGELGAASPDAYYDLALDLFRSPDRLADIKSRLDRARGEAPLFDAVKFARDFERALDALWNART